MKLLKKIAFSILPACILSACLGMAVTTLGSNQVDAAGTELVQDGKFATTFTSKTDSANLYWNTGWVGVDNTTTHTVSTSNVSRTDDGSYALSITNTESAPNSYVAQDITLKAGVTYTISADIKVDNVFVTSAGATGAYVDLYEAATEKSLSRIGYYYSGGLGDTITEDWKHFSASVVASNSGTYKVNIRKWGSPSGTMYVDNVSVIEQGASDVLDGAFATAFTSKNDSANLYWKDGWQATGTTQEVDMTQSHTSDGSGALKITNPQSATSSYAATKVYMERDARYRISAYIKLDRNLVVTTANGNGGGYLSMDNKYGTSGGLILDNVDIIPESYYDWNYCSFEFTAVESGMHLICCKVWGSYGTAYFDDVKVEKIYDVDPEVTKHWSTEASYPTTFTGDAFTLIGIGDTQMVASYYPDKIGEMFQWMADKKDDYNIQYAMHLGDIVDNPNDLAQWDNVTSSHQKLQDAGLKYSLSLGNHDYEGLIGLDSGTYVERNTTRFNSYFPASNYVNWLGTENFGLYENGKMDNTWHKFTYGGHKYLIIAFEYGPNDSVLAWANEVVASNPDHHVIVTTHAYLNGNTGFDNDTKSHLRDANSPQEMWDEFIKLHSNIFMVLGGHYVSYGVNTSVVYGIHGNPVIQMKVDPQNILGNSETLITLYRITNGTNVETYYYSISTDRYYAGSNFSIAPVQGTAGENGGVVEMKVGEQANVLGFVSKDEITPTVTVCTSSNPNVATIDENGIVTAVGVGETTITYMMNGRRSVYANKGVETKYTATISVVGEVELNFKACTLSLQDNIYIQYAVATKNVRPTDVKVLVWETPQTAYVYGTQDAELAYDANKTVEISGTRYPYYAYTELSMKEMTDVVYACIYANSNGMEYYSAPLKYSILEYAYNKLGYTDKQATSNASLKTLLNDMLEMGASMQIYANHNVDSLPTANFTYVSVENATFEDGFNHGLYIAGTTVDITPDEGYAPVENLPEYMQINGNVITLTVPEEMTLNTGSFTEAVKNPVNDKETTVKFTQETTYSYNESNVVKAVENVNENYVAIEMSNVREGNDYYAVGINVTGTSTGWNGGIVLAWKQTGFNIRLGGVNESVFIKMLPEEAMSAVGNQKITIAYKLTYIGECGACTHVQLEIWYGIGDTYTKAGVMSGEATSGEKWSYDATKGAFIFDYDIVAEDMLAPDCTLVFMKVNNYSETYNLKTTWTVHGVYASETKFEQLP